MARFEYVHCVVSFTCIFLFQICFATTFPSIEEKDVKLENIAFVIGSSLNLSCIILPNCSRMVWQIGIPGYPVNEGDCDSQDNYCHYKHGNQSVLSMTGRATPHMNLIECQCEDQNKTLIPVRRFQLSWTCQAFVEVNSVVTIYNSSSYCETDTKSPLHVFVTNGTNVTARCQEGLSSMTNCTVMNDETSAMIFITSLDTHCYVECNSTLPSCHLKIAFQAFNEDDMRTGSMKTPLTTMNSSFPPIFIIISSTSIVFIIVALFLLATCICARRSDKSKKAIVPTYSTVDKTPRTSNSTELDVKGTTANDQVKDGDSCHTSADVEQYYWEPDNVIPTTRSNALTNQKAAYLDTNDELQLPIGNAICRVDDDTMYDVSDISFNEIAHHKQTKSNPASHFVNETYMTVTV
ncbi:hypothetical protein BSL78_22951 [Apostichopus japonicus]|uniref:Ig-like domain-containing protein n=1 Tax=Stichopus japonicus TaxID=307972 RepID=A0A2G8JWT9_STIJA|nr:hypothetical protein BSL78_22951 [Apostichopus japonicus]